MSDLTREHDATKTANGTRFRWSVQGGRFVAELVVEVVDGRPDDLSLHVVDLAKGRLVANYPGHANHLAWEWLRGDQVGAVEEIWRELTTLHGIHSLAEAEARAAQAVVTDA